MAAKILDGKAASAAIRDELRERVAKLAEQGVTPGLATVLIGDDEGSQVYVRMKHKACADIGIHSVREDHPADVSGADVLRVIETLNADPAIDGYLIQYPVPDHLDYGTLIQAVDPTKDADGLHPMNLGHLALGARDTPRPCTPLGVVALLERNNVPIAGRHVVIVGRGPTAGRPLAMLLSLKEEGGNATVTQCHTGTQFLPEHTRSADILVAAAGKPGMITADMVKPGAAVVDIGISRTDDGIAGDVAPDVVDVAAWLAPVPGGVGPMTIAMLLRNTVERAEQRASRS
ncbi:MAG: bifunctional methylenetetrahydrofolate dehydrogenase/methenyltetrahydrofolate cyclohydrolase [Acidimicrobiia bacterium]|nr:bifunctional methylenetetrahydrofolate dehydrogenase/methenyltetrahydrofolate cyclohydrolase [Acidimicrobiia bacterium]